MRLLSIGLVLASLAGTGPALAQDAEQKGLARDLLGAAKMAENFDAIVPTVFQALKPVLAGADPKAAKDFDELIPILTKEVAASESELLDQISTIYARNFDKAELRQFIAFYRTPAGMKLAQATPALAQQMMAAGQSFGQQIAARLSERMRTELRKRGNNI